MNSRGYEFYLYSFFESMLSIMVLDGPLMLLNPESIMVLDGPLMLLNPESFIYIPKFLSLSRSVLCSLKEVSTWISHNSFLHHLLSTYYVTVTVLGIGNDYDVSHH